MLTFLSDRIITPILPFFLGSVGIVLYVTLGFFPFHHLKTALSPLLKNRNGSSFRALAVALAGTLGVGNIIGVAYAITEGGAGSLFWMWVSAFLAMIVKYGETVLAIRFRKITKSNPKRLTALEKKRGGAMYYIPHKTMARAFAVLCILSSFTVGNLLQSNAISEAFSHCFQIPPYFIGILLAFLTLAVIWRGIARITSFCSFIIPLLSLVYLLMCGVILLRQYQALPALFAEIFREAFSMKALTGGIGGSALFLALKVGFSKGLITNEAGCGTAPIAHASADTDSPAAQGMLGIVEVFFDTIVLCTASGLVLLIAHKKMPTLDGYALVSAAFTNLFGKIGDYVIAISLFFFVLATLVGWSFYGRSALEYFTESRAVRKLYLLSFSIVAFLGTIGRAEIFWRAADVTVGLMTLINTGYILFFRREIRDETERFLKKETRRKR